MPVPLPPPSIDVSNATIKQDALKDNIRNSRQEAGVSSSDESKANNRGQAQERPPEATSTCAQQYLLFDNGASKTMLKIDLLSKFAVLFNAACVDRQTHCSQSFEFSNYVSVVENNFSVSCPSLSIHCPVNNEYGLGVQDRTALKLAVPMIYDRENMDRAPKELVLNFVESFSTLIDSRLRSSVMAMLRKIYRLKQGSIGALNASGGTTFSGKVLDQLLSIQIKVVAVVITFHPLTDLDQQSAESLSSSPHDQCLPLIYDIVADLQMLDRTETVEFRGSGSISGRFSPYDNLLTHCEFFMETAKLLKDMIRTGRALVRKAMSMATTAAAFPSRISSTQSEMALMELAAKQEEVAKSKRGNGKLHNVSFATLTRPAPRPSPPQQYDDKQDMNSRSKEINPNRDQKSSKQQRLEANARVSKEFREIAADTVQPQVPEEEKTMSPLQALLAAASSRNSS